MTDPTKLPAPEVKRISLAEAARLITGLEKPKYLVDRDADKLHSHFEKAAFWRETFQHENRIIYVYINGRPTLKPVLELRVEIDIPGATALTFADAAVLLWVLQSAQDYAMQIDLLFTHYEIGLPV